MKKRIIHINAIRLCILSAMILLNLLPVYSFEVCDSLRGCTVRALTLDVPYGKGAHYVDVQKSPAQQNITNALSVELWMNPTRQQGKIQFVAGLWGPGSDKNDVWVLYFNENDELVFELNSANNDFNFVDNTIVKIPGMSLYNSWHHIVAVFNGTLQTAYIYVDTELKGFKSNLTYPLNNLRIPQKQDLAIQIGSCNSLSDNKNLYRTFLGQMDEIRIWSRVLPQDEIYCNRLKSINGNEPGLVVYFRCNEHENQYDLCDASGNGSTGRARSGARCTNSNRQNIPTFFVSEKAVNIVDTLKCDTTWSMKFTIVDTSACGNKVWFIFYDDLINNYSVSPAATSNKPLVLQQNVPQEITVTLKSNFLGSIVTRFYTVRTNACDDNILKYLMLTRITELSYSKAIMDFDTIKANCQVTQPVDSVITICNNSRNIGSPRSMRISNIRNKLTGVFSVIGPGYPIILAPDQCVDITVRFNSNANPGQYYDTLEVLSDDKCLSIGKVPIMGAAREIISISDVSGNAFDTLDFGTQCLYLPSNPVDYIWQNLISEDVFIDSIIMPAHFIGTAFKFPLLLEPQTGYLPNYFRFFPTAAGNFLDSIIFLVRSGDCLTRKKIYVRGKGFFADVKFTVNPVDFGLVKIGQQNTLNVTIENKCDEVLNVSFYLKGGDPFFFNAGKSVTIPPGQTRTVAITFIPTEEKTYFDELCLFEQRCYTSSCIKLTGQGYFEKFSYDPVVMRTENVIGCQSRLDTLTIKNISVGTVTVNNFILDNLPLQKYSMVYPADLTNFSKNMNPNDTAKFIFRFTPNDVLNTVAERAFLRYKTSPDGIDWAAQLYGTSIIPKIFVTDQTIYGQVEVGDRKRDTIEIYNYSKVPIRIDSILVTNDYQLIYPLLSTSIILAARDSIMAIVDFTPSKEGNIVGDITVYSSDPCEVDNGGFLIGTGIVIPLDVPMTVISNGFVRPCDCEERKINLINQSLKFPRTIESILVDTTGIPSGRPDFFSWRSVFSPSGTTPYDIPALTFDTLYIKFCPRTPAEKQFVDVAGNLIIEASGQGWEGEIYTVFMTGKRQLIMEPFPNIAYFPPTRVDTFSNVPQYVNIEIPDLEYNPVRDDVRIDSIKFEPDERVFYVRDTLGIGFPLIVDTSKAMTLEVNFKPRAVRPYQARMYIYISKPCPTIDTTVLVYGESFAPSFGLDFNFDNSNVFPDTFRVNYCDTLKIPVYSSREFPADIVDIRCGLSYDTTKMQFLYADSPYLSDSCFGYFPSIKENVLSMPGKSFLLKNFCRIDSTRALINAYFLPIAADRDTFSISIDSLFFDTEEVILYQIIAQTDRAVIIVLKPDMLVLNSIDFDSVQVLDCAYDTLKILNNGDTPITNELPFNLPDYVKVIAANPSIGGYFKPGDTSEIIFEFCPRKKFKFDNLSIGTSNEPCLLARDFNVTGEGWSPIFPVKTNITPQFIRTDSISAVINDTVIVPIYIEKDFSVYLMNQTFKLRDIDFDAVINYNKYAMKYIDAKSSIPSGNFSVNYTPGFLRLQYGDVDVLDSGQIAETRFVLTVPDSIISPIFLNTENYETDSLMFLDIQPVENNAILLTNGKCLITSLVFDTDQPVLFQNFPNPWLETTQIDFYLAEDMTINLSIINITGQKVKELFEDKKCKQGINSVQLLNNSLEQGIYFYQLSAGSYILTKQMILIK